MGNFVVFLVVFALIDVGRSASSEGEKVDNEEGLLFLLPGGRRRPSRPMTVPMVPVLRRRFGAEGKRAGEQNGDVAREEIKRS